MGGFSTLSIQAIKRLENHLTLNITLVKNAGKNNPSSILNTRTIDIRV